MKNERLAAKRRTGREMALQMLCQIDQNPLSAADGDGAVFWGMMSEPDGEDVTEEMAESARNAQLRKFVSEMAMGAWETRHELDAEISAHVRNWSLRRLGVVERNVLRLGAWELKNRPGVPRGTVVNEAIDMAKYFSNTKAGRFVNGVLDKVADRWRPRDGAKGIETPQAAADAEEGADA